MTILCRLEKTLKERRQSLMKHVRTIDNHILLSDMNMITKKSDLKHLINYAISYVNSLILTFSRLNIDAHNSD